VCRPRASRLATRNSLVYMYTRFQSTFLETSCKHFRRNGLLPNGGDERAGVLHRGVRRLRRECHRLTEFARRRKVTRGSSAWTSSETSITATRPVLLAMSLSRTRLRSGTVPKRESAQAPSGPRRKRTLGAPWSRRIGSPTPSASAGTTSPLTVCCVHAGQPLALLPRPACCVCISTARLFRVQGSRWVGPAASVDGGGCGGCGVCRANLARYLWQWHALWRLPPHDAHRGAAVWLRHALRAPRPQPQQPWCVVS